jgi:hypothetical protein
MICHWFACILGMLRLAGETPLDTWHAKFGLCTPAVPPINNCTGERDFVCVTPSKMYLKTFSWAMGLITGSWSTPNPGPYDPHFSTGGNELYSEGEDVAVVVITLISSAVWAYVTRGLTHPRCTHCRLCAQHGCTHSSQ